MLPSPFVGLIPTLSLLRPTRFTQHWVMQSMHAQALSSGVSLSQTRAPRPCPPRAQHCPLGLPVLQVWCRSPRAVFVLGGGSCAADAPSCGSRISHFRNWRALLSVPDALGVRCRARPGGQPSHPSSWPTPCDGHGPMLGQFYLSSWPPLGPFRNLLPSRTGEYIG